MPLGTSARLFACLLTVAFPAAAQQVDVQLREAGSQAPIGGAIVRLVGEAGIVAQGLSNAGGRLTLRAPGPGSYRIRVDRIGWVGILSAPVELAAEQLFRTDLFLPATRLELPTVEVRTTARCDRQGLDGRAALAIWEEVQKALTASVLTEQARAIPLHVREFRRWLQRNGTPIREFNVRSEVVRGQVFASLAPATLAQEGFVLSTAEDTLTFAVPDARLLTSDEFAATHCFGVTPGDEGLVGLTFEPAPGRRLPDVSGTLWVDAASGELAFLEYSYTGLEGLLGRAGLGGRVEFQQLAGGAWIVKYWHVRTPDITVTEVRGTRTTVHQLPRHTGYVDLGGRVDPAGEATGEVGMALVTGHIIDQTADGVGLAGVLVQVQGTDDGVMTGSDGSYQLAVRAFGEQVVTATHPKLDVISTPAVSHVLSLGDTTVVDFEVPPIAEFVRSVCGGNHSNRSGVVGLVLDGDAVGVEGLEVRASWRVSGGGTKELRARTGKRGLYGLCDLPGDDRVTVIVYNRNQALVETTIEVGFRIFSWLDLWLPVAGR